MVKIVYLLASKARNQFTDDWEIHYHMDNPPHRKDILEYWSTPNITDAKRFNSREEITKFLLDNPQLFSGAILLEYTEEYLDRIKDDNKIKNYIRTLEGF